MGTWGHQVVGIGLVVVDGATSVGQSAQRLQCRRRCRKFWCVNRTEQIIEASGWCAAASATGHRRMAADETASGATTTRRSESDASARLRQAQPIRESCREAQCDEVRRPAPEGRRRIKDDTRGGSRARRERDALGVFGPRGPLLSLASTGGTESLLLNA